MPGILKALALLCLLVPCAAAAGVTFFSPSSTSIASLGVIDISDGRSGEVFFATNSGLSVYDGGWQTFRVNYQNASQGLLSTQVTAVEQDHQGILWVGFSNGIQRLSPAGFDVINDQQLLKNLAINALHRSGESMWVATGRAGVHRYRNGSWEWFQPFGPEGLGCNEARSIAEDPGTGTLYFTCGIQGVWALRQESPPRFEEVMLANGSSFTDIAGVRQDPLGGVFLFNRTAVLHHSFRRGREVVSSISDLAVTGVFINDVSASVDGTLWAATASGLYRIPEGGPAVQVTGDLWIENQAIKKVHVDSAGRIWFVTPDRVGFFSEEQRQPGLIPVVPSATRPAATISPSPSSTGSATPLPTPEIQVEIIPSISGTEPQGILGIFEPAIRFLQSLLPK